MAFNSADEVLGALVQSYYDQRDVDATLACVTDDIEWVGTENNDSANGKAELRKLLEADVAAFSESFSIELDEPIVQIINADAVLITVAGKQVEVPGIVAGFAIRGTVCIVNTEGGWLVKNVHTSVPNSETEKIALQNELNAEREKQLALLQNIPGGMTSFRLKKDGHVYTEFISDGLAKLCGYESGKAFLREIAENTSKFVYPGDFQIVEDACKRNVVDGGTESIRYRIYDKNGKILWLQLDFVEMKQIPLNKDDIAVFYGVQTLVSEDVIRAETEQNYYRMVLDITETTYFELDENNKFYTSEGFSAYKVSDYGLPAIMGNENAKKCFHPDDLDRLVRYLHGIHSGSADAKAVIVRSLMKDGSYQWTEITAHVEFTDEHKIRRMTGILRNVNPEWEKQKAELELALADAENANKAKTDFLSRVSHDMRTPLNGILGLTTLLKDSVTDKDVLKDLNELEMSGNYLLDLINDTLDMSRIESGNLELHPIVYDGRTMFNNVVRLAKMSIKGKNIKFDVKADNIPFTLLYVDASRFEQVVMNVIGNAVKFTPDGGSIDVTMTNISIENGVITDKLVIADTGIGMSKEFLPHIFEAFSQADSSKTSNSQGTGLGMAITKQLIQRMDGDITVESELGKGSTFTITFKLQMATDEQIEEWEKTQTVSVCSANFDGKRVLLCEDHPLNTQIATRLLGAKGVEVEHAENGQIAVDMFKYSAPGYYNAILMDIRMPVMDGIEATKVIRSLPRKDSEVIPIIAMTANAFADDIEQTKKAGMDAHLSKPIQTNVLYQTLAEIMNVSHENKKQKILVVDDVEVNRAVIKASLEQDYEILEAENGKQAMDIIRQTRGLDAVITDIQMPEMDGIELIRQIRSDKKYRHMVIIANTQFGNPEQEEHLLALGANDFVYKPTTPTIVEIRVRNALKRI